MGKRTRGYGAVYHRPDGRWEGQIRIPGGGRRSFYTRTRREVIRRLTEARRALGQGLPVMDSAVALTIGGGSAAQPTSRTSTPKR
jgi:hypothetical protein